LSDYKIETGKNFIAKVFVFYIFISNVKAYLHLLGSKKENKHFPQISGVAPLLRLTDLPQATNLKCQMVYQQREKNKKALSSNQFFNQKPIFSCINKNKRELE